VANLAVIGKATKKRKLNKGIPSAASAKFSF